MDNSVFSIFGGKYFNQNLICLIISYIGVFYACKNGLCCLAMICWFLFIVSVLSICISLGFYTYEYSVKKVQKAKSHKLRNELAAKIAHDPNKFTTSKDDKIILPKDIMGW